MTAIQKEHFALIIKYLGISFITGAISHGFFSGERQIITAIIGIGLFVIGTILLKKEEKDFWKIVIYSSFFAISLGAFTGGIQHFLDSPDRSVWIVPLGFLFSVYFYLLAENHEFWKKKNIYYALISFIVCIILSFTAFEIIKSNYLAKDDHHSPVIETSLSNGAKISTGEIDKTHVEGDEHNH